MADPPANTADGTSDRRPTRGRQATAVIIAASIAMAATLPGRTHGLGIITTRLLADFPDLTETSFAHLNLVATLLGAVFCLPCGWLIDRYGPRIVLLFVMLALATVVGSMTLATTLPQLAIALTLTRGVGQSMLSVVSIAMMSKWFCRQANWAMGTYAVVMTMLMAGATGGLSAGVATAGWRVAWRTMAWILAGATVVAWPLALRPRREDSLDDDSRDVVAVTAAEAKSSDNESSATLSAALRTRCFWAFSVCISMFGMTTAGISLFQQLIFEERQLAESVYHAVLIIGLFAGIVANFVGGWLSRRHSMSGMLAVAMVMLAASLVTLPLLQTPWQAYLHAAGSGVAGGLLTVLFFGVWRSAFGPEHLGRIQSVAQMMTVLASATGPEVLAWGKTQFGSYGPILFVLSGLALLLAGFAWLTAVPSALRGDWRSQHSDSPDDLKENTHGNSGHPHDEQSRGHQLSSALSSVAERGEP